MKNTKLIQLLGTFSVSEFGEFGKFVNSPFHNNSPLMKRLYDFLKKYHPGYVHKNLTKENAYIKLYGSSKYDDKKLRERFSDLFRLAEEFMTYKLFKKDIDYYNYYALKMYAERDLKVHFDKKYSEIMTALDKKSLKDEMNDYKRFLSIEVKNEYYPWKQIFGKRKLHHALLDDEAKLFVKYFITTMLRYYCLFSQKEITFNCKFDYSFYKPVMEYIENNDFSDDILITCFFLTRKIEDNHDDYSSFYRLKDLFFKNADKLKKQDAVLICNKLYNYALDKSLNEEAGFREQEFEIVKRQLKDELYVAENNNMSREQFISFVVTGTLMGDLKWSEHVVKDYSDKVSPSFRKSAVMFAKGLIHFHQKKYDLALSELNSLEEMDFIYYVRVKTIIAKIYYEQGEYERIFSIIDSFKHYIRSNSVIPKISADRYLNFMNAFNKLVLLAIDNDDFKLRKLEKEIMNQKPEKITMHKKWLLEKIKELKDPVLK